MSEHRDIGGAAESSRHLPRAGRNLVAVIGIDRYERWGGLHNAVSDAQGVLDAFEGLGFEIAGVLFDAEATHRAIRHLVDELEETIQPDDRLVVFFAGHGWSKPRFVGNSELHTGYLIPVDGSENKNHAASWIDVHELLRNLSQLKALHVLVILDACNAGRALSRVFETGRGSGPLHEPYETVHKKMSRMLIASTLEDEVARDGGIEPDHSLFTTFLLEGLQGGEPAIEIGEGRRVIHGSALGHYVRHRVQCYDGDIGIRQTPGYGGFHLHRGGEMPILLPPRVHDGTTKIVLPTYMLTSDPAFVSGGWTEPESDDDLAPPPAPGTGGQASVDAAVSSGHVPRPRRPSSVVEAVRDRPSAPSLLEPRSDRSSPRLRRPTEPPPVPAIPPGRPARSIGTLTVMSMGAVVLGLGGVGMLIAHRAAPPAEAATPIHTGSGAPTGPASRSEPPASPSNPPIDPTSNATPTSDPARPTPSSDTASKPAPTPSSDAASKQPPTSSSNSTTPPSDSASKQPPASSSGSAPKQQPTPPPAPKLQPPPAPSPRAAVHNVRVPPSSDAGAAPDDASWGPGTQSGDPDAVTSASAIRRNQRRKEAQAAHPGACFADTNVSPNDADILHGNAVVGKTRQHVFVPLPCGVQSTLTFHKLYYSDLTKAVVPTHDGESINKRMTRILYPINVSSDPSGAEIMLGGKSIGVTPMTVKISAGESATVELRKEGYAPISQSFVPTANRTVSAKLNKAP